MSLSAQIANSLRDAGATAGDFAFGQLTPEHYARLRLVAHSIMRSERPGHTLQPTAVLHEAINRLVRARAVANDSAHFFRLASQAMRHVLTDYARQRRREKRLLPVADAMSVTVYEKWMATDSITPLDALDIDRALDALARKAPRAAQLLELRYFAGLEDAEISAICNISRATVERECRFARAFLILLGKSGFSGATV